MRYDSPYIQHMIKNMKQLPEDVADMYLGKYKEFQEVDYRLMEEVISWI